ncbi:MAG: hypothetical protein QOE89_2049 [Pseudonocardiales bacterium]|nr:hypothetical protein [Pseudonocardiales bacterium]
MAASPPFSRCLRVMEFVVTVDPSPFSSTVHPALTAI